MDYQEVDDTSNKSPIYKTEILTFLEDSKCYFHIYQNYGNRYGPYQDQLQDNRREDSVLKNYFINRWHLMQTIERKS